MALRNIVPKEKANQIHHFHDAYKVTDAKRRSLYKCKIDYNYKPWSPPTTDGKKKNPFIANSTNSDSSFYTIMPEKKMPSQTSESKNF